MISHKLSDNCRPIINQIIRLITIARLTRVNIPTIIKHFAKMNEYFRNFSMYWVNKHISCIDDDVCVCVCWLVCVSCSFRHMYELNQSWSCIIIIKQNFVGGKKQVLHPSHNRPLSPFMPKKKRNGLDTSPLKCLCNTWTKQGPKKVYAHFYIFWCLPGDYLNPTLIFWYYTSNHISYRKPKNEDNHKKRITQKMKVSQKRKMTH